MNNIFPDPDGWDVQIIEDEEQDESESLVRSLREIFPQMCPQYLENICQGKRKQPGVVEDLVTQIIEDYNPNPQNEEIRQPMNSDERLTFLKARGMLQTCGCCYDDEILPDEIFTCDYGCIFCKQCVRKSTEVAFGEGKLDFKCLSNCSSSFSLQTLQDVLDPKMFSKVAQKKQIEEVKAAGMEDLETCPFCDFACIPVQEDKLFKCLNPDCMKESCRLCKELSHIPLRCDEVEKENDVKIRTFIENKMTEALIRTCYKCGNKFIKADGCNKMTCPCGAFMCYVCKQPVTNYKHFNGLGGDKFHLCPLYSNTEELHEQQVLKGAEDARQEIGLKDVAEMKIDPTADVRKHYTERTDGTKRPKPRVQVHVNRFPLPDALGEGPREVLVRLNEVFNLQWGALQPLGHGMRLQVPGNPRQHRHHNPHGRMQ